MALQKNPSSDLRAKYKNTMLISFIAVLSLIILAFEYFPKIEVEKLKQVKPEPPIKVDIIPTRLENRPPPPPKPVIPVVEIIGEPEDLILENTELDIDKNIDPPPPINRPKINDNFENKIFVVVEEYPSPVGGVAAILKNVKYPSLERKARIEGTVIIEAVINKKGDVVETKVIKSVSPGLDNAALTAVEKTKFYPGKQRGKPVNVRIKIPIKFKLN